MTISDQDKLDLLFKHAIYGMAKTADVLSKTGANETILSPKSIFDTDIWTNASDIPTTAPGVDNEIVAIHVKDKAIKLSADPTAPENMTWLSAVTNIIPANFGVSYAPRVWIGDPSTTACVRLYPDTSNEEWLLDGNAGVLLFPNTTPVSKTAQDGTTVTVADHGLYLEAYAYVGPKGFPKAPTGPLGTLMILEGVSMPANLGTLLDGARIASIEVEVLSPFDAGVGLLVGNGSTSDYYASADLSDLATPGLYLITPRVPTSDPTVIVSLTDTVTQGAATVRLHYA